MLSFSWTMSNTTSTRGKRGRNGNKGVDPELRPQEQLEAAKIISAADVAIENTDSHSLPGNLASIKISLEPVNWQTFHRIMEGLRPLKFINRIS